ncbi:MAG: hypothetical protein H7230_02045 [Candidatus Parcubacteria bacterium]|nr:hypothetical protein [Candidatus Paceibacterota bacterium]
MTQSAGRGLRLNSDDPNKVCLVVEFIYEDVSNHQVTFPDILGQAEIYPPNSINRKPKQTESQLNLDSGDEDFTIGSFEIIANTRTVFELTQKLKPEYTEVTKLIWTEIVKIIRDNKIVSSSEYQVNCQRLGLPTYATLKNMKEWTNPRDFFGNKDDLTLKQVKVILEKNNITTETEYLKIEEKLGLPNLDCLKVKPDWWGFDNLINGVEKPLSEYSRIATESGIQNQRDYKKRYKKILGLVTYDCLVQLPGWTNLSDFLASEKNNDLKYYSQLARNAEIKSKNDYNNRCKSILGLISIFKLEKFQDWTNWDEFLGLKELTLREMSAIARTNDIDSVREYEKKSGNIEGLFSHQILTKMPNWPGFRKFIEGDFEEF